MTYDVMNLPARLILGKAGENKFTDIQIDVSAWARDGASYSIIYMRSDSSTYPVAVTADGTLLTWTPTATDLISGYGKMEVRMYQGETIAKSVVIATYVSPSLEAGETPEEITPDWAKEIIDAYGSKTKFIERSDLDGNTIYYGEDGKVHSKGGGGTVDAYTKAETDELLEGKADQEELEEVSAEVSEVKQSLDETIAKIDTIETSGNGSDYFNIKNPVRYRVGLCSDIHVGYWDGQRDFAKTLETFKDVGCEFVGFCGDIQSTTTFHEIEYEKFSEVMASAPYVGGETFFGCRGNHDVFVSDDYWKTKTGCDTNYYFEKDGDVYVFLSPSQDTDGDDTVWTIDWTEAVEYLESVKQQISGKRIFAFVHYPFYGHAGVQPERAYGFKKGDAKATAIYEYFKSQNAIIFGGHSHISYRDENRQSNLNIDRDGTNHFATYHLMSTAQSRDYDYSENKNHYDDVSEATVMDVCDGYVVLHNIDLVSKEIINSYVMFDDLGYTRKGLLDSIYTYNENENYVDEVANGKASYSNLFPSVELIDNAVLLFHKKALNELLNPRYVPTNQIAVSIDTNGSIYNGKGWREDTRLNSSGTETSAAGYGVTGYIPYTKADTLYLYNCQLVGNSNTSKDYLTLYDNDFNVLRSASVFGFISNGSLPNDLDENGYVKSISALGNSYTTVAYIRFSASGVNENAIVTKNETLE